jgi:hypothetical protein
MLARLMLALLVSASIAGNTGFIRDLYDSMKVPSALAGGHGNNGNENQNGNGNGNNGAGGGNGVGNGNGNGGGNENGNGNGNGNNNSNGNDYASGNSIHIGFGIPIGNGGSGDDGRGGKSIALGQYQADNDSAHSNWPAVKLPPLSGEKELWERYLEKGMGTGFRLDNADRDSAFKVKDLSGAPQRKPLPTPQPVKENAQPRQGQDVAIGPGSYVPLQVLAVNLSPAGLARARVLGFQVEDTPLVRAENPVTTLTVPGGMHALQAIEFLRQNLPAERFQLNRLYRLYRPAMKEDGEPRPSRPATLGGKTCAGDHCYARAAIHWKDSFSSCARNVKIGVIDTDIDLEHPAFKQQNITQRLFIPAGKQPAANWHGTGVLALLAGRPDSSTPGLIPEATFFAASIFYADGEGDTVTDTASILRALKWMTDSGTKLVNMSFSGPQDDLVQAQIESLSAKGLVFLAAAGNDGPTAEPAYPAAYPQVIAVTAVTKEFRNYPYANRGSHIDVAAPGVDIWTAWPDSREGYRSGTSFASPFVAAVLAILPPDRLKPPKDSLFEQLQTTDLGLPARGPVYGRGLLQAPSSCPMATAETADNRLGWAPRAN